MFAAVNLGHQPLDAEFEIPLGSEIVFIEPRQAEPRPSQKLSTASYKRPQGLISDHAIY
jgi:hypothetical protein